MKNKCSRCNRTYNTIASDRSNICGVCRAELIHQAKHGKLQEVKEIPIITDRYSYDDPDIKQMEREYNILGIQKNARIKDINKTSQHIKKKWGK
jgi:DNA-directed RNA polymerase subunit RPC12/RpoP